MIDSPTLALLEKAVGFHQTGNMGRAEALYDEVLKRAPGNIDALNLKGVIAADAGRHLDAISLFARAIASSRFVTCRASVRAMSMKSRESRAAAIALILSAIALAVINSLPSRCPQRLGNT